MKMRRLLKPRRFSWAERTAPPPHVRPKYHPRRTRGWAWSWDGAWEASKQNFGRSAWVTRLRRGRERRHRQNTMRARRSPHARLFALAPALVAVALALLPPARALTFPSETREAARAPRRALLARARLPARHLAVRRRGAVRPVRPHRRRARLLGRVALRRVPRPPGAGSAPPRRRVPKTPSPRRKRRRRGGDVFRGDERAPQRLEHRRHVREPAARLVSVLAPARARPGRRPSGRFDAGVARRVLP